MHTRKTQGWYTGRQALKPGQHHAHIAVTQGKLAAASDHSTCSQSLPPRPRSQCAGYGCICSAVLLGPSSISLNSCCLQTKAMVLTSSTANNGFQASGQHHNPPCHPELTLCCLQRVHGPCQHNKIVGWQVSIMQWCLLLQ